MISKDLLNSLPEDVVIQVLLNLDFSQLLTLHTIRLFQQALNNPYLWHCKYLQDYLGPKKLINWKEEYYNNKKLQQTIKWFDNHLSIQFNLNELKNFRALLLFSSNLHYISPTVSHLNLNSLYLWDNYLTDLPIEIGRLPLELLDIGKNHFKKVPSVILNLTKLEYFHADENKIRFIPEELANLEMLKVIDLEENTILFTQESLKRLKRLRSISIKKNKIRVDLPEFGNNVQVCI